MVSKDLHEGRPVSFLDKHIPAGGGVLEKQLSGGEKPCFVTSDDFHGVNTPTMADFKLPT